MKTLLAAAAIVLLATPASAGSNTCSGPMDVGPEWSTVTDTNTVSLPTDDHFGPDRPRFCRFKTKSPLGERILRTCPNGSYCTFELSIANNPTDARYDGPPLTTTVVKWPHGGVYRD